MRIDELNKKINKCRKCRLSETRTNALCGEGKIDSKLMLIAQAPGEKEDKEGRMFIGPSGKVLDELLKMAFINREEIYMTNLIKCMLPKYRKPKEDEIENCSRYLSKEIELINPKVLVPLGYHSTKYIFKRYTGPLPSKKEFHTVYGKLFLAGDKKVLPLSHPAALLYNPSFKKDLSNLNVCPSAPAKEFSSTPV